MGLLATSQDHTPRQLFFLASPMSYFWEKIVVKTKSAEPINNIRPGRFFLAALRGRPNEWEAR
jgi:hypothetical protein